MKKWLKKPTVHWSLAAGVVVLVLVTILILTTKGQTEAAIVPPTPTVSTPSPTPTPEPEPTPTPQPTPTPEPTPEPTEDFSFVLPDPSTRPVAVMIDNQGLVPLPQGGIRQAQVVYEILTEYRITRFLAFFWNTLPEMAGPVRSTRHYFLDWVMEYDAIFTLFGWSPQAQKDISSLRINTINGLIHGNAFWDLDPNPGNWQDSYTSAERVANQLEKSKYRTEPEQPFPFAYSEDFEVPETGESVEAFEVVYGKGFSAGYEYRPEVGLYDRFRSGEPHMERNTGLQVTPRNVLIQVVPSALIAGDDADRIQIFTVGTGKGWLMTGGKSREITWKKASRREQTQYAYTDGSPLVLNPGQLWIEIIPTTSVFQIPEK